MPEQGVRSTYSQCPFQLYMCDDEGVISTATAFFYQRDEDWFLVTNWHNVSGKSFTTGDLISPNRRSPTRIQAKFAWYVDDQRHRFTTIAQEVPIYGDGVPLWFEHPQEDMRCDVVALKIDRPSSIPPFMHNAANRISNTRIPVKPGSPVFIIGFPQSISIGIGLPLWKSGYIASEPHYDVTIGGELADAGGLAGGMKLPAFFLDALTRQGMSGSPVFASYTGTWDMTDPYKDLDPNTPAFWQRKDVALGSSAMEFIGVYSGRIGKREEAAGLGLCWKKAVLDLICEARKPGKHPHLCT